MRPESYAYGTLGEEVNWRKVRWGLWRATSGNLATQSHRGKGPPSALATLLLAIVLGQYSEVHPVATAWDTKKRASQNSPSQDAPNLAALPQELLAAKIIFLLKVVNGTAGVKGLAQLG
jgi:hypothetical protein